MNELAEPFPISKPALSRHLKVLERAGLIHDHGAKTRMTLSDGPYPAAGRAHAEAAYNAALDKLAKHLGHDEHEPSALAFRPRPLAHAKREPPATAVVRPGLD